MQPFMNREGALQAGVNGLHRVSLKCVAWLVADPVIVSKHVAIGVKAGIFGEVLRRLQGEDGAETEVPRNHVPRSEEHTSNSSHQIISYAVFCLKKKTKQRWLKYLDRL